MTESTYDPCFFYRSGSLGIVGMHIDNTLILTDNNFASKEKEAVTNAKIMIKNREYLIPIQPIKFNGVEIKIDSNGIVLIKKSHIGGILPVIDHDTDSTSSKGIKREKLLLKKQYLA